MTLLKRLGGELPKQEPKPAKQPKPVDNPNSREAIQARIDEMSKKFDTVTPPTCSRTDHVGQ